jgi:hypothetical protein
MSEGMAVAACRGDESDLLRAGQTAALFDEDDELSIYSTLSELLTEREYARRLAKGSQELLRAEYTVSNMVAGLIDLYRGSALLTKNA